MQNLFSPEALHAAADFVIALDQHRFGAVVFLGIVVTAAVVSISLKPRQTLEARCHHLFTKCTSDTNDQSPSQETASLNGL